MRSIFVGNTLIYVKDVEGKYHEIDVYDTSEEGNENLGNVILETDYDKRIAEIEQDVYAAIKKIESLDVSGGLDDLKVLAYKLY